MKKKTLLNLFVSAVLVLMGNVTYGQSTDATLSGLTTSSGALSPSFASGTYTGYSAPGILYADAFTVTPTVNESHATVQTSLDNATWTAATSGSANSISLVVGSNTVYVKVTAQDGITTLTYDFTVTRAAISTNANLSALTISAGTLAPVFASGTITYTATVNNATSSVTETPTVADATATIQIRVNGGGWTSVTSGSASGSLALTVGTNPIDVKVTAQDGVTTKTYTTTVTRQSYDAKLSALTTSAGALSPAFAPTTYTGYSAPGILYADAFTVTPTVNESHATVQISLDNATWSSATSGVANSVALAVGSNNVYVKVTAQDVSYTHTYLFTVTRAPKSTDATLSNLVATTATFSSPFVSSTIDYQTTVPYATSSITVTPTVNESHATVQVRINNGVTTTAYADVTSGSASAALNLNVGDNMIDVNVTAQDGVTMIDYRIKVTRGFPSSNADLSNLVTDIDPLNTAFASGTTSYNKTVGNATSAITVTPTVADATATIKVRINGSPAWGSVSNSASAAPVGPLALNVGNNTVEVQVTAQDGSTVKTYSIAVLRTLTDADLSSLTINHGTLTPVFDLATLSYTVTVDNSVTTVAVTPTVALGGTIAVDLNGGASAAVTSGTASANQAVTVAGPNVIHVAVTNGITTTYTITITRLPSSDAKLSNLVLHNYAGLLTLNPVFDKDIIDYNVTVDSNTANIAIQPTPEALGHITSIKTSINYGTETDLTDGHELDSLALNIGDNMIHNVVTAEDGVTKINYRIKVTRTPPASWGSGGGGIGGGGGGGLESKSLGDAIVKRVLAKAQNNLNGAVDYSKLSVVQPRRAVVSTTGATTFGLGGSISSVQLADIMPDISSIGFVAYNSSPTDLTSITNAKQVLATDFTLNSQPQAVAFATMTLGELYDHTKPICDRLKGAALMDVKNMNVGGYNFVQYTLLNEQGGVEYATSFTVGTKSGRNSFSVQSSWLVTDYVNEDVMYNFQLWAAQPELVNAMVTDILNKLKSVAPVSSIIPTNIPAAYIASGTRDGANLNLVVNNRSANTSGYFMVQDQSNEVSTGTVSRQIPFTLNANGKTTITIPMNDLYQSTISMYMSGAEKDVVYMSDGTWSYSAGPLTSVNSFKVTNDANRVLANDELPVFRNVQLTGNSADFVSIVKLLKGGGTAADLSAYKTLKFTASGGYTLRVTLVKNSVTNWADQYYTEIKLDQNQKDYYVSMNSFISAASAAKINPNDVTTIIFAVEVGTGTNSPINTTLSNVSFAKQDFVYLNSLKSKDIQLYPNPSTSKNFTCNFYSDKDVQLTLSITDLSGKTVALQQVNAITGLNIVPVSLTSNVNGIHIVSLQGEGVKYNSKKVVIVQ